MTFNDGNGNDLGNRLYIYNFPYGINHTFPNATKQGYALSGWNTSSNGSGSNITYGTLITNPNNHTIYAQWTPNTYTVSFDYNGATGGNSQASKTVTYDSTYGSLPTPTKAGYTFLGWHGKNILNLDDVVVSQMKNGTAFQAWATPILDNNWIRTNLKPNTTYSMIFDVECTAIPNYTEGYDSHVGFLLHDPLTNKSYGLGAAYEYMQVGEKLYNLKSTITTPSDLDSSSTHYMLLAYTNRYLNNSEGVLSTMIFTNIQIEEASASTLYEPYYITSSTKVVNDGNVTLTAMWGTTLTNNKVDYSYNGTNGTDGSYQEFIAPQSGTYKIELWGASGGDTNAGKGGYTSGNKYIYQGEKYYIYVGAGQGICTTSSRNYGTNFNGGGFCSSDTNNRTWGVGGGATDIRLVSGSWDNFDSLKSRIMIAAGGGGGYISDNGTYSTGGSAGGLNGYSATNTSNYGSGYGYALGATQILGGQCDPNYNLTYCRPGTFGSGGNDTNSPAHSGGGGGYYGGAQSGHVDAAAGGSSFISGYTGCNAISDTSTSSSIVHTNQPNHYSGKTFANGVMIDGEGCNWSSGSATSCGANQPQPNGTNTKGHTGNGYARITLIN